MASKTFAVVCAFAVLNMASCQVILPNYVLPGYPQTIPLANILPNQLTLNSPFLPSPVVEYPLGLDACSLGYETYPVGYDAYPLGYEAYLQSPLTVAPTTTIIQDNSVANNLANCMQLLVVSQLLSNTLPRINDAPLPYIPTDLYSLPISGVPGYSYIY